MTASALTTLRSIDLRIPIIATLMAALCAVFWLDSRYPSLQGKAGADPERALSSPLGFERHITEPTTGDALTRIVWTAKEWALTNQQGMTFGLLLAAGMLTLIPLVRRPVGGRFSGAVQGFFVGTPMGVCVNCAAPIGQAMLRGGSRVEVALATIFSAPSFNVIILGMLFSLFPFYLVAIKLAASVIMVLAVVPLLSRLAERPGWRRPPRAPRPLPGLRWMEKFASAFATQTAAEETAASRPSGILGALGWVATRYLRNLWIVLRLALPLMLLAGLVGAVLVELLPWGELAGMARVDGAAAAFAVLVVVAAFGVLLPVPIAFDMVVCAALWNAGVPPYIVAALLITLGIYSIYPWSLLAASLSGRIASLAALAVLLLGIVGGAAAGALNEWHESREARAVSERLATLPVAAPAAPELPVGQSASTLNGASLSLPAERSVVTGEGYQLFFAPHERAVAAAGDQPFTRVDGAVVGFERMPLPRPYEVMLPGLNQMGGLAAGDVDGDGWPEVAVGSSHGVYLYRNLGGHFALQTIDFPAMRAWTIGPVALVDLNGNGALDLFFGTWMNGSHILFNRGGEFSGADHVVLPRGEETAVHAVAFADVDRDGNIDIVTGATTSQSWYFYPRGAVNHLWRNQGDGQFTAEPLPEPQGETLSLLFTDLNGNHWPDLLVGNDYDEPDVVFLNEGGQLRRVTAADSPIPYSTTTTMSLDTGDVDNDGFDELYIGEIAMGNMGQLAKRLSPPVAGCSLYAEHPDRARCDTLGRFQTAVTRARDRSTVEPCFGLSDPTQQRDCIVTAYHWNRVLVRLPTQTRSKAAVLAECERIPEDFRAMHDICATTRDSPMDHNRAEQLFPDAIPSVAHTNLLYSFDGKRMRDVTEQWAAGFGGWSWNAKFADLDNDGWQDLYVAQGTRLRFRNTSGVFYHNQQGRSFKESTVAFGLDDHRPTGSYLLLDYDLDGDLDLITYPFQMTPVLWRNDAPAGEGFSLRLEDRSGGNRAGIGARVEIRAADGRLQQRSLKASGGYQSHDAPRLHFGLGDWPAVARLTVRWPDGQVQTLADVELGAGRYRFVRLAD